MWLRMHCFLMYLSHNSLGLSATDMKILESSESSGKSVKRHEQMPVGGSTSLQGADDKDKELCTILESEERTTGLFEGKTNFISFVLVSSAPFCLFFLLYAYVTQGLKTQHMLVFDLFIESYSTIHLLQNIFTESKHLTEIYLFD